MRMYASTPNPLAWRCGRQLVARKSLTQAKQCDVLRLSVARFDAEGHVPTCIDERIVAMPLARVASCHLWLSVVGCDCNQPSWW